MDVLIPTCGRHAGLAVTLTGLAAQTVRDFRVVISDQTEDSVATAQPEVRALVRMLRAGGREVDVYKHLPRRGMAEQRQFLLDQAQSPYVLYLDDDIVMETDVLERMLVAIEEERCGFVGCAVIGLSFLDDVRPQEQHVEFWDGPVQPETIEVGSPAWYRHRLHSAANLYHVTQKLGITRERQRKYKVAWVGGCVLFDRAKLLDAGAFGFWRELPRQHSGEDVLAQLRVMSAHGGCGLIPSGVYHLELPTTVPDRHVDAPKMLHVRGTKRVKAS